MMKPRRPICCWFSLALVFVAPALGCAQEPGAVRKIVLPSLDSQVAARLIALDGRLNAVHSPKLASALVAQLASPFAPLDVFTPILADVRNQEIWEQLPEEYYRMTQESGSALVTMPSASSDRGTGVSSGQVRRLCHQRLAALPRASLEQYRQRVDAEAKTLLEQGRQSRSAIPLRRLVDELFCSTAGDAALDLLGDLAFERAEFDEARHWWSLLTPLDGSRNDRLLFPHPKVDLVRVRAKQILALIFHGRLDEAQFEISRFHQQHPQARGHLAGQNEVLAATLQKTLASFAKERISNNEEPWTTFGGDTTRNRALSQGLFPHLWDDGPTWRMPLPSLNKGKISAPNRGSLVRRSAFHPVIANEQVLITDHRSVVSYQLSTGKELFRYDLKAAGLLDPGPGVDIKVARPRFTLSVDHERAYVRLGGLALGPKMEAGPADASYLVCLDLTQPERKHNRELWHVRASSDDHAIAFFEGSPLVHDGRVYIAQSKLMGRRVLTSIVCYDVLGRQRWAREVCDCPEFEDNHNGPRHRQHLLTWAGGQIVYCSHAGAIAAVDATTGQPTWGVRYPSRGPLTAELEPSPRDLTPALYADSRVYAAPLDTDRLFCIEAATGQLHWEAEGDEIVHLLAVSQGRLIVATQNGLTSIHASNGQTDWSQPSEGRLPGLGRGLLAGSWLIWPTQDAKLPYRAVTLQSGSQQKDKDTQSVLPEPATFDPTLLHTLPVGNLAFGQGCLAIAGLDELSVFVPAHRGNVLPPVDPRPQARLQTLYQQARWHASAGANKAAAQAYAQLLDVSKSHPHSADWRTLIDGRLKALNLARRERKRPEEPARLPAPLLLAKHDFFPNGPALPLIRAWSHDDAKVWPTDGDECRDDFCFCTKPGQVVCRALADGALRWKAVLEFEPTWFGRWRDLVIITDRDEVQALRVHDGKQAWSFFAPSRQWRVGSVQNGIPKLANVADGFVHVERWDDTLLLLDDHRRLFRLRLDTGEAVWQSASPAASLRPLDAAAFEPHVSRVGSHLLVQSVTGQSYLLDTKLSAVGSRSRPWLQTPQVMEQRIIYPAESGRIIALDQKSPHAEVWEYNASWRTSLTGELCRLVRKDSVLLAFVPYNGGYQGIRLEPSRGTLLWKVPAGQLPTDLDLGSMCIGDMSFYYVHEQKVHARSLNDGTLQWTQLLPGPATDWQMRYTKNYLVVYPTQGPAFCVSFIDPWDGSWLQRLAFPDARGPGEVVLTQRNILVSVGGRIYGFRQLEAE